MKKRRIFLLTTLPLHAIMRGMDMVTAETRSRIMARIRSEWTWPERFAHGILKGHKIRHRMHADLPGRPDILLKDRPLVIFIDGCFWHGHRHCRIPDIPFWQAKIARNRARDRRNDRLLRRMGLKVRHLWECQLSSASLLAAAAAP